MMCSTSLLHACWLRMYRHSLQIASAASASQHAMMHVRSSEFFTPKSRMSTKPVFTSSAALLGATASSTRAVRLRIASSSR